MALRTLSIDLECYSGTDLSKAGVYRYAEDPDFQVLLFGYSINGGDVRVVDMASGEKPPKAVIAALTDNKVIKIAHNASFERVCLSRLVRDMGIDPHPEDRLRARRLGVAGYLDPRGWRCSMVWSAAAGLPLSLHDVAEALDLAEGKMDEGRRLIRRFCTPKQDDGGLLPNRVTPSDAPEDWRLFKEYNRRDVEVMNNIIRALGSFPVPGRLWEEYAVDQEINDRGVRIDKTLVGDAILMDDEARSELTQRLGELTNLPNPNSPTQLKVWLLEHGVETDTLGRKQVAKLKDTASPAIEEVLDLRQRLAKSSVSKYKAMSRSVCADGRCHGMFMFHGATRTGRWAGRLVQLQNLPQNHLPDLGAARALVKTGDTGMVAMLYDDVLDTLSQLIRTAFIPAGGMRFCVADFAAIEARVIAWYAREKWRLDTFRNGGDIYCASASQMFHKPVVKHGVNGELRAKGKIAELALGYGGGVGALKAMGALDMGVREDELQPLVTMWRNSSPNIVKLWWRVDKAAKAAIQEGTPSVFNRLAFRLKNQCLQITLPSGRNLVYRNPRVEPNRFGGESITYDGYAQGHRWTRVESYGPKLVENIVQATARDILCNSMLNLRDARIVMHVHDELIVEAPQSLSLEEVCARMQTPPAWADGLPLRADGYECVFYMKD